MYKFMYKLILFFNIINYVEINLEFVQILGNYVEIGLKLFSNEKNISLFFKVNASLLNC